jgi:hypothetical protein
VLDPRSRDAASRHAVGDERRESKRRSGDLHGDHRLALLQLGRPAAVIHLDAVAAKLLCPIEGAQIREASPV